jgi:hypothetical protein
MVPDEVMEGHQKAREVTRVTVEQALQALLSPRGEANRDVPISTPTENIWEAEKYPGPTIVLSRESWYCGPTWVTYTHQQRFQLGWYIYIYKGISSALNLGGIRMDSFQLGWQINRSANLWTRVIYTRISSVFNLGTRLKGDHKWVCIALNRQPQKRKNDITIIF